MEVVEGKKAGTKYYVHENYLYRENSCRNGTKYLICIKSNCNARGMLKNGVFTSKENGLNHSHPSNPHECQTFRFRQDLRSVACTSNAPAKDVYYEVAEKHPEAAVHYPYPSAEPRLRKQQRITQPPLAENLCTLRNLLESEDWKHLGETILSPPRPFFRCLLQSEDGAEILLFLSPEICGILDDVKCIHVDGTFKIVPHGLGSHQLTTIHVVYQNKVYAAVYALMSQRTKAAYLFLINYIKNLYPELRPESSMSDYEIAERLAIAEAFPGIQTKGCWFHFAQAIWKKHQQLGLCALCETNGRCRKILRMLMSLPLLPANQILDGIYYIEHKIETASATGEFAGLMNYMWRYWLCQVTPDVISVYGCTHRTNNDVENFHMQLFRQSGKQPHPSLWNFIKILREMDRNQSLNFLAHQRGSRHCRNRRYSSKVQDNRIKQAEQNLLSGAYNVGEFLSEASNFVFTLEAQLRFEATPGNIAYEGLVDNAEVDDPQVHLGFELSELCGTSFPECFFLLSFIVILFVRLNIGNLAIGKMQRGSYSN